MEYKDLNDSELVSMINEDEEIKDILYNKYKYIIDIIIKKYISMAKTLGIEYNDLYQESMIGFIDAINNYNELKEAGLPRFISVCVERRLNVAIIKASRLKNKIISESLSLEHTYEHFKLPLMDILSDNNENNPLENIVSEEDYKELIKIIKEDLSESEYEVYNLMVSGLNYQEIATILDKIPKQIDNSMQRIKNKIKKILERR